ncbi:DUF3489 domain-containing protein [Pseudotabrizicola sp.]|uniref:DUF3489 domain-containing protein n=1 Tax=Pseudotabrizicola sp. TaxID=2939647 RepID=UPI002722746E|nr:DUF3489 domain-containing protein [Pseudotabrizicola sp.]MDO8883673.1 DUF3489 domain-containing protein [Pseudotabrizicola sp.]
MTKLNETQTIILSAGAQRPENIALPPPKVLAGAAAKMAVNRMIEHGWLQDVEVNLRRGEPLWRETGDGHGTTLVFTEAGLLAIGIQPLVVKTVVAIREQAAETPMPKPPFPRAGTKQAMLNSLLQRPERASIDQIVTATGWNAHSARGLISGVVITPFLTGCIRRTYAAIFSFWAGVMPPMPMFGRSLLYVHSHCVA